MKVLYDTMAVSTWTSYFQWVHSVDFIIHLLMTYIGIQCSLVRHSCFTLNTLISNVLKHKRMCHRSLFVEMCFCVRTVYNQNKSKTISSNSILNDSMNEWTNDRGCGLYSDDYSTLDCIVIQFDRVAKCRTQTDHVINRHSP